MIFHYLTAEMIAVISDIHNKAHSGSDSDYFKYSKELLMYVTALPIEAQIELFQAIYTGRDGYCSYSSDEVAEILQNPSHNSWESVLNKTSLIEYLETARRES